MGLKARPGLRAWRRHYAEGLRLESGLSPTPVEEAFRTLGDRARRNLAGYDHVDVIVGDGDRALAAADLIAVSAGVALVPRPWIDALAIGGRLVVPLTGSRNQGWIFALTRRADRIDASFVMYAGFSPCLGTRDRRAAAAIDETFKSRPPQQVTAARLDRHRRGASCWLHTRTVCLTA